MKVSTGKRLQFIDVSKGLAMLFIIFTHAIVKSSHLNFLYIFLCSFHIPLFFILSGYTFNAKTSFRFFIKKKFLRLIVPYFIWALIFIVPYLLFGQSVSKNLNSGFSMQMKDILINIIIGNGVSDSLKQNSPLWFLPALFSMEVLFYFIIKYFNNNLKIINILIIILFTIISFVLLNYNIILPFGFNTVFQLGIFFYVGYLLGRKNCLSSIGYEKIICLLLFFIGIVAIAFNYYRITYIDYDYGKYFLMVISGFSLSFLTIILSKYLIKFSILEYLGINTLGLLIFHKLPLIIFQAKLFVISKLMLNSNFILELSISLISVFCSILFSLLINYVLKKIFPLSLGVINKK